MLWKKGKTKCNLYYRELLSGQIWQKCQNVRFVRTNSVLLCVLSVWTILVSVASSNTHSYTDYIRAPRYTSMHVALTGIQVCSSLSLTQKLREPKHSHWYTRPPSGHHCISYSVLLQFHVRCTKNLTNHLSYRRSRFAYLKLCACECTGCGRISAILSLSFEDQESSVRTNRTIIIILLKTISQHLINSRLQ